MPPIEIPPTLARAWGLRGRPDLDKMRKYRVLRSFCIGEGIDVTAGDVVTLPERQARHWVALSKLAPYTEAVRTEELEHADPELEHAEAPARKTRRAAKAED